jgi:hypothetical protein
MLTQAMPAVTRALSGVLPPVALRQLTQALGNCNQTVVQRGDVVMRPDAWTNVNNNNGTYTGDTWNVNNFGDLLNNIVHNNDYRQQVDIANTQYGDQFFDFSQRLGDNLQNIFNGGDTINIGGDTIYGDTIFNITNPTGRDGRDGRDGIGRDGTDGRSGRDGTAGGAGPSGPPGGDGRNGVSIIGPPGTPGAAGQNGSDGRDGGDGLAGEDGITTFVLRKAPSMPITYLSGANPRIVLTPKKTFFSVMVGATFDAETCQITEDKVDIEVVTGVEAKLVGLVPQNVRVLIPPGQ